MVLALGGNNTISSKIIYMVKLVEAGSLEDEGKGVENLFMFNAR
jgi:hypothetical protein